MNIKDYDLGNLVSEMRNLEKIQRKEYIRGICNSLFVSYSQEYNLDRKQTVDFVYNMTEIYCEDYLDTEIYKFDN